MINTITHKQKKRQRYNRFNYISALKQQYGNKFYKNKDLKESFSYSIFYKESGGECYIDYFNVWEKYEIFTYSYILEIIKSHIIEEYRLPVKQII